MPNIPATDKFHVVSSNVDTTNRGSASLNNQRNAYTMQDVIDTVAALPGSGTENTLAKFGATGETIGNSSVSDNGTNVSVDANIVVSATHNIQAPLVDAEKLHVTDTSAPVGTSAGSFNVTFGTAPTGTTPGFQGDIIIDANAIYVCTATDVANATWLKAELAPL